jgi:hypothetical protein
MRKARTQRQPHCAVVGIVFLLASDRLVAAAMSLPGEAFAPLAIKCEQPANTTAAPGPRSEPDMGSILRQFTTHTETLSQMEAWRRERSKSDAPQGEWAPSTMKEALNSGHRVWLPALRLYHSVWQSIAGASRALDTTRSTAS